jgi:hypothetical protein
MSTDNWDVERNEGDSLNLHKGYIDLHFMTSRKIVNTNFKQFNLAFSLKDLVTTGRQFEK